MANAPVRKNQNRTFENCRIMFKNFSGKEGKFNREGDRNFALAIDHATAEQMVHEGWNIKELQPREEGDPTQPYLKVTVKYPKEGRPPRVVLITSAGKTELDEETCGMIDWAQIRNIDLIIRPYDYDFNGNQGRAAYLKSIFVTIEEDELDIKYAGLQDSALSSVESNATPWENDEDAPF